MKSTYGVPTTMPEAVWNWHAKAVEIDFFFSSLVFFFFLMWTIFKVFIEFVTVLLWFCYISLVGFWLQGRWHLSSPTRVCTCPP